MSAPDKGGSRAAIEARRDWRKTHGDLSPVELRLDDECLAKHYAEDVTALIEEVVVLRNALHACLDDYLYGRGYEMTAERNVQVVDALAHDSGREAQR